MLKPGNIPFPKRFFILFCKRISNIHRNTTILEQQKSYRILGVDPGTNVLGFAILQVDGKALSILKLGVIHFKSSEEHQHRLQRIFEQLQEVIEAYTPREMAIEAPFFGKNVQSMLKLGRAQGVAIAAAITKGVPITEYSPKKIKQAVAGNGNAAKEQVAAMMSTTLGVDLKDQALDATDALAAAVCHYYASKNNLPGAKPAVNSWAAFARHNPDRVNNPDT